MKTLLRNFVADLADPATRSFAFARLMDCIEIYRAQLSGEQIKEMISWTSDFSTRYQKTWPWQRSVVIAKAVRELN